MNMAHLYRSVTNNIVAELEAGAAPWLKPWKNGLTTGLMPQNAATGRPYTGINIPILWSAADLHGYPTHEWLTFKQAVEEGAHVRKGERGTTVVFTKQITVEEEGETKQVPVLRTYTVFNKAQIDGLREAEPEQITKLPPHEAAERFIAATRADIRFGGNTACYVPSQDFIALPPRAAFASCESFYATALHECGHWSGAERRLDRNLAGRFGTRGYAAEELIAELTAAFLCAHLGITGELRHAGYIQTWINLLRDDDRAIFTAASKASQAADYLRSFSEPNHATPAS